MLIWFNRDPSLCGFISCTKRAVWRHPRGSGIYCEEHRQEVQKMFGGILTFERIEEEGISPRVSIQLVRQ